MTDTYFKQTETNGINSYVWSTTKFKTNTIVVNIERPLSTEYATEHALMAQVLRRGTARFPSLKAIKQHLDDLYGATFYSSVAKRGERHILQFGLEIANENFLSDQTPLLDEGIAFLGEILAKPTTEDGGFVEQYIASEKQNLRQRIDSLIDDKIRYAAERCIGEMCHGEPYSVFNYGSTEQLAAIDRTSLYESYENLLRTAPIDVFVVGDVDVSEVQEAVTRHFRFAREQGARERVAVAPVTHPVKDVRTVVEGLDVAQGKLNLGCRTQTDMKDSDYAALMVYNGILGGFPHSKLFLNVREKESLAYYAASRLESHKGLLTIQSGIEIENYERAVTIMRQQLAEMTNGNISDSELSQTKTMLANQLREIEDRPQAMIDFYYNGVLSGKQRSLPAYLEQIDAVQKEDVVRVASKIALDTIYFLRDRKEE